MPQPLTTLRKILIQSWFFSFSHPTSNPLANLVICFYKINSEPICPLCSISTAATFVQGTSIIASVKEVTCVLISVLSSSPPYGTLPIVQVRYSSRNSDHVATLLSLSQLLPRLRDLSALQNLSSATLPSSTSSHCVSTSSHLLFLPLGLPCFGSPYGWLLHITQDSAPSSSPLKAFQQSICGGTHCLSQPCHSILF